MGRYGVGRALGSAYCITLFLSMPSPCCIYFQALVTCFTHGSAMHSGTWSVHGNVQTMLNLYT